jgi:hypothetical protein
MVSVTATAVCAQCRRGVSSPVSIPVETDAAVLAQLVGLGWRVADAVLVCPECTADAVCAAAGHVFAPWRACHCRGDLPGHAAPVTARCGYEFRYCARCAVCEDRHTLDLPTPGEACLGGAA